MATLCFEGENNEERNIGNVLELKGFASMFFLIKIIITVFTMYQVIIKLITTFYDPLINAYICFV